MVLLPIAYTARRLNPTTFLIVHDDSYSEHPFIYAKLYPHLIVLIDTGCGRIAPANDAARFKDLREFLEGCPVADNGGVPLNAGDGGVARDSDGGEEGEGEGKGKRKYLIVTTHCHYDHVMGITSFNEVNPRMTIIASGYDRAFLSPVNRTKNSLCDEHRLSTPRYDITFAKDGEWLRHNDEDLKLQVLHTPGHTPDSLAVYDEQEGWLFTGDTFYLRRCVLPDGTSFRQPIIFPPQGNFTHFAASLDKLIRFVDTKNAQVVVVDQYSMARRHVKIGCAHTTEAAPAAQLLADVKAYFRKVAVTFQIPVVKREARMGEVFLTWQEPGDPQFSLVAPERLRLEYGG